MAHKVEKMVFAGATPWHGLGTNVSGLMTSHDALVKANLNWQVVKKPLFYNEHSNDELKTVPNTFGVFRESDDGLIPLTRNGKSVGKVWTALQNADAECIADANCIAELQIRTTPRNISTGAQNVSTLAPPRRLIFYIRDGA